MKKFLKVIHFLSIACFLGSIITYVVLGVLVPEKNAAALRFNREWVAACTTYLTIPALWLAGLSGILMSGVPRLRWLWAKLIGFTAILVNTYL